MVYRELLGKVGIESERIDHALNEFLRVTDFNPLEPSIEMTISGLGDGERQAIGLASTVKGVVAVGYDDRMKIKNKYGRVETTGALLIRNSWGRGWGEEGYGWLPYEYILKELAKACTFRIEI